MGYYSRDLFNIYHCRHSPSCNSSYGLTTWRTYVCPKAKFFHSYSLIWKKSLLGAKGSRHIVDGIYFRYVSCLSTKPSFIIKDLHISQGFVCRDFTVSVHTRREDSSQRKIRTVTNHLHQAMKKISSSFVNVRARNTNSFYVSKVRGYIVYKFKLKK